MLLELAADEPTEAVKAYGCAAVVYSEEDDWSVGLPPDACRALAKKLLELAARYELQHGSAKQ